MKSLPIPAVFSVVTAAPIVALSLLCGATACEFTSTSGEGEGEGEGEAPTALCSAPIEVPCREDSFTDLAMSLDETAADGLVVNTADGGGFDTAIDATSNGPFVSGPWVYARFGDAGMQQVVISDDESFDSMDWDIAAQRFVVRVNSGDGGPSCVSVARTAPDTDFDALSAVPDGLTFRAEHFQSDPTSCELEADGSGQGSPGVVLQGWWSYPNCVATTGNVYVLQLKDGRHVKFVVTQYYAIGQEGCNANGTAGSQSAHLRVRWAFLD